MLATQAASGLLYFKLDMATQPEGEGAAPVIIQEGENFTKSVVTL